MARGPTFEVRINRHGDWFWHEKASNGKIVDHSQAYSPGKPWSRANALRAARRKASQTKGATVAVVPRSSRAP